MSRKHFDDLTKIDCPLNYLYVDTFCRLCEVNEDCVAIELFDPNSSLKRWIINDSPFWFGDIIYRVKPVDKHTMLINEATSDILDLLLSSKVTREGGMKNLADNIKIVISTLLKEHKKQGE